RRESHPQPSRRQRGALLIELRVRKGTARTAKDGAHAAARTSPFKLRPSKWWEALVTLQSSLPAGLTTSDLQSGSWITSPRSERDEVRSAGRHSATSHFVL